MTKGGRNLTILGISAIAIALITTSVSLVIYKFSGDIYIDRSRPGFLPDEEEIAEEETDAEEDYEFLTSGNLTAEDLDEYLEALKTEVETIDRYEDPYSASALSDDKLGI